MVIGHSFGGGVAIKLAAEHPERVSYLVLLDAVGGVAPRPPWDWAASFVRELWPPASAAGMAVAIAQDLVPNLVGNPVGLLRIGSLARTADLRNEAEQLRARGLPVLVLTGQADSVIPKEAFETLCDTIGTDGRIVVGGHSWMLADPDSFAVEVAPVVDRIVATHREDRATSRSGELDRLLGAMKLPRGLRRDLVEGAPPLWLLSDTTAVLAADLALAHPGLQPNEVRAVARPIAGSADIRLTVVANDRTGLLADSAAVLSSGGLSILGASAATWPDRRLALHSFVIEDGQRVANEEWDEIGRRLRVATMRPLRPVRTAPPERVTLHGGDRDQMLVTVTVRDEMGALSNLCRKFSDHGVNIESLHARSVDGRAVDTFLVSGVTDAVAVKEMFTPRGWRLRAV
jgi:glycine cleavage system regulatory protein